MSRIVNKTELVPNIHEMLVEAPQIAAKALPGQFVVVMADETGERVPLTIADFDRDQGTITLILMVVGTSSRKLARLRAGDAFHALLGPLGHPSEIEDYGSIIMVAGGVGTAPIYPIARALRDKGNRVITIQGARNRDLLFWRDRMAAVSDEHIITTDDGSAGRKGLVTEPLRERLAADNGKTIGCVYAIGPTIMMKCCSDTTRPFDVRTIVSLNTIMVDGTGMCGGCRVEIGGETRFTCVDGPEFDGHLVNWSTMMARQRIYHTSEQCSLTRYLDEVSTS
ncbi:MAG: sulfide/dihydroorotate dehydrogenase-like FAD/NAD-binding protein [Phycisphaerae bacterium]|nr:sulfide/dihydroorotate dehydrogenase-like FAD/NAD-binding protein [Phycisphaerae bacterium]